MINLDQPSYLIETPIFVSAEAPEGFIPPTPPPARPDPMNPNFITERTYFAQHEEIAKRRRKYNSENSEE